MFRPRARPELTLFAAGVLFAAWAAGGARTARAYTVASAISSGCHERITSQALRAIRLELATAAPIAPDRNEQALIHDVEFPLDDDMKDLGAATLLLAVRDNDLKGRGSSDVSELAFVHGNPQLQQEHCLRATADDEPGGSASAIARCRDFITGRVTEALGGLDGAGAPDAANRTTLAVYLALRHGVNAPLPTYYVRIGQAIHALEDSFTHAYRTGDGMQVTVDLNWVDEVNGTLNQAVDGPPHAGELDRCDDPDDLRRQRRLLATEAATALLRATLDPASDSAAKTAAVAAVLDRYLGYAPGCTFDNDWCDAPEHKYGNSSLGCSLAGGETGGGAAAAAIVAGLLLATRARRRRRRRGSLVGLPIVAVALSIGVAASGPAQAADAASPDASDPTAAAAPAPSGRSSSTAWGGYVGASGSVNYGGLAAAAGGRLRFGKHWTFGLTGEWNPWFAVNGASSVRAGAFNGYGTVIVRVPLAYERFDLRTTASLGTSTLLIDLYGAPKWTTGVFVGFNPLGIEWAVSKRLFVILDPLGYALPVPQLHGVPFAFPQYRASLGLEVYAG